MDEREDKFRLYNEVLVHAATCTISDCLFGDGRCVKVRSSVDHFKRCFGARRHNEPIERYVSNSEYDV